MILFVLCMELLLRRINSDGGIKGFKIKNFQEIKYITHADDVNFLLSNEESLLNLNEWLKTFDKASNLRLNIKKTNILNIGKNRMKTEGFETVADMKILGIWANKNGFTQKNTENLKNDITCEIERWNKNDI